MTEEALNQATDTPEQQPAEATPPAGPSLEEQLAQAKDQHLRALAEVENVRRRAQKEREETSKFAVTNFAREILVVADNARRALDAIPAGAAENDVMKNFITGIEATERQLLAIFDRFAIKPINPLGQPFDPHFHRVMMEVEDASKTAGTVVQVLQTGYVIHDRLLREALVAVAKGGPVAHPVDTTA